jgi:hypothetical protein
LDPKMSRNRATNDFVIKLPSLCQIFLMLTTQNVVDV